MKKTYILEPKTEPMSEDELNYWAHQLANAVLNAKYSSEAEAYLKKKKMKKKVKKKKPNN